MKSLIRIELIGHIGADPEVHPKKGGTRVASLSLATIRQAGGGEATDWRGLTFGDQKAGLIERYVNKGDRMWVEGELRYSSWREGDERRYASEIQVSDFIFLGTLRETS